MPRFAIPLGALALILGAMPTPSPAQTASPPARADVQQQYTPSSACQHMLPDATPEHCVYHARNSNAARGTLHSSADELLLPMRHMRAANGMHRLG